MLTGSLAGMTFRETLTAVEAFDDWSRVRSPARAQRRLKRGFRQNIDRRYRPAAFEIGGVIYAHPEILRQLRSQTTEARS
ncbi:hypothetical protein FQV39_28580 [Bosea sp. F3-2]|uniref:hypothetical protein n=1 Tax=Bosea sp. F3-2 TaxID=2599640 RepID=UPI0011F01912|nr:hypothetical protein [Bosea sp. F3-2]QEL26122.1 hypothetical protein FQV39_28580 [Bosea sp. F3-2]